MVTPLIPVETSMRGKAREGSNHGAQVAVSDRHFTSLQNITPGLRKGKQYDRTTRNTYMLAK